MRLLVDITHPAHAHFFHHSIHQWQAEGHEVIITSRDKDLTFALLDEFGFEHIRIGHARQGIVGLGMELPQRAWGLNQVIRRFRPDVAAAVAGTFLVYGGLPHRVPIVVFYDTEHANLSNMITYPMARAVVTPRAYQKSIRITRHIRYNGYQELAYTHPNVFAPSPSVLALEGLAPGEPFSIVRLVNWAASHDIRDSGIQNLRAVVEALSPYGRVILSSEKPLPPDLDTLTLRGSRQNMLHLQAFASLFFGESATMASECAMLGTPAIFLSTSQRGYINEQQARYDMVYSFNDPRTGQVQALQKARELLEDPATPANWQIKRERMLNELIDVTAFIVKTVLEYAN
jgi:predicted glycosyltransferase